MYIRNYNEIRIVAKAWDSTKVKLDFAVKQNDGKYYYVNRWEENNVIKKVFIYSNGTLEPNDRVVESPDELVDYFTHFKPTDAPAIVMTDTKESFAQWKPVSPKGTIAVRQRISRWFHTDSVEILLPNDHCKVLDGGSEDVYESDVFWNPAEAMLAIWENASKELKRIVDFCRKEETIEQKDLAVGATRIAALLKFQEKTKSVEERISSKWNSMSTSEKAKALKIPAKPVTKSKTKTKSKKK